VEDNDPLPGFGTGFVLLAILGIALLGRLRRRS
jgi:PGF-CTERM protein